MDLELHEPCSTWNMDQSGSFQICRLHNCKWRTIFLIQCSGCWKTSWIKTLCTSGPVLRDRVIWGRKTYLQTLIGKRLMRDSTAKIVATNLLNVGVLPNVVKIPSKGFSFILFLYIYCKICKWSCKISSSWNFLLTNNSEIKSTSFLSVPVCLKRLSSMFIPLAVAKKIQKCTNIYHILIEDVC